MNDILTVKVHALPNIISRERRDDVSQQYVDRYVHLNFNSMYV